jgi:hypothetical protein
VSDKRPKPIIRRLSPEEEKDWGSKWWAARKRMAKLTAFFRSAKGPLFGAFVTFRRRPDDTKLEVELRVTKSAEEITRLCSLGNLRERLN